MVVIIAIVLLITALIHYRSGGSPDSVDTLPYIVIGVTIMLSVSVWNSMRRQKKIFESFRLTVSDDALIREQLYTSTITIEKQHVRQIVRLSTGQFLIDGGSRLNSITVPSQIDNADELARILSGITPISEIKAKSWTPYLTVISALAGMLLIFAGFTAENVIISTVSGIALSMVMLCGFIVIQKSRNVEKRLKRMSYFFLIPFISILSATIIKLMS